LCPRRSWQGTIRKWLIDIDDAELQSGLGLTVEDIAVLREWYATNPRRPRVPIEH